MKRDTGPMTKKLQKNLQFIILLITRRLPVTFKAMVS